MVYFFEEAGGRTTPMGLGLPPLCIGVEMSKLISMTTKWWKGCLLKDVTIALNNLSVSLRSPAPLAQGSLYVAVEFSNLCPTMQPDHYCRLY